MSSLFTLSIFAQNLNITIPLGSEIFDRYRVINAYDTTLVKRNVYVDWNGNYTRALCLEQGAYVNLTNINPPAYGEIYVQNFATLNLSVSQNGGKTIYYEPFANLIRENELTKETEKKYNDTYSMLMNSFK